MNLMLLMSATLLPHLSVALGTKMKVISTDPGASLPAKSGRAEMVNSSLGNYPRQSGPPRCRGLYRGAYYRLFKPTIILQ